MRGRLRVSASNGQRLRNCCWRAGTRSSGINGIPYTLPTLSRHRRTPAKRRRGLRFVRGFAIYRVKGPLFIRLPAPLPSPRTKIDALRSCITESKSGCQYTNTRSVPASNELRSTQKETKKQKKWREKLREGSRHENVVAASFFFLPR